MRAVTTLLTVTCMAALVACGGSQDALVSSDSNLNAEFEGAPEWVKTEQCNSDHVDDPEQFLCAVGISRAADAEELDLAIDEAKLSASASLVRKLKQRLETVIKRSKTKRAMKGTGSSTTGKTQRAEVSIAKMDVSGIDPKDKWISSSNNIYILVALDRQKVMNMLKSAKGLTDDVQKQIDKDDDEIFKVLKDG